jgi:hypothetical protein
MSEDYQNSDDYFAKHKDCHINIAIDSAIFIRSFFTLSKKMINGKHSFYFDYNKLNESKTKNEDNATSLIKTQLDSIWDTLKVNTHKLDNKNISDLRNRELCLQESYKRLTGEYFHNFSSIKF